MPDPTPTNCMNHNPCKANPQEIHCRCEGDVFNAENAENAENAKGFG